MEVMRMTTEIFEGFIKLVNDNNAKDLSDLMDNEDVKKEFNALFNQHPVYVVKDINDSVDDFLSKTVSEETFDDIVERFRLSYITDGDIDIIKFNDYVLWDSEMDEREWIEEYDNYEPLKPYIIKLMLGYIKLFDIYNVTFKQI